jgi:hypothetical protein
VNNKTDKSFKNDLSVLYIFIYFLIIFLVKTAIKYADKKTPVNEIIPEINFTIGKTGS